MWDNPRILNLAAGFLVGLAVLAFAASGLWLLARSGLFPVRHVEITTPLANTTRREIESAVRVRGNFFVASAAELRSALEQLPWVRRVSVRRVWPDRLEVALEEHVALARWGDGALVNSYGETFFGKADGPLPVFLAPAGTEREVALRYGRFASLVEPLGARLERVVLTPRFAWQLRLGNGLHLMLGRDADAAEERLRRFVEAYASTLSRIAQPHEYVDLRYPNGFALRVPELKG